MFEKSCQQNEEALCLGNNNRLLAANMLKGAFSFPHELLILKQEG